MLLILAAVVCWSGLGVMGKELYRLGADPLTVVVLRVAVAAGLLGLILAVFRPACLRVPARRLPGLAVYGLLGVAVNMACFFYALQYTTVTTAIVIASAHPAMVVLLARLVFAEPLSRQLLGALGVTLAGVFLVAEGYNLDALRPNLPGVGFALANASGIAAFNVLGKRLVRGTNSWTVLIYGLLFGGAVLAVTWAFQGEGFQSLPAYGWSLILGLAVFPSILAYGFYLKALTRLAAGRAAIASTLEPVLASFLAWAVLGETVTALQALGVALVLGGVLIIRRRRGTSGPPPPQRA
ncbi:MAG: EamA family transporter [Candidatus Bipolaricaulota bacterium]